MNRADIKSVPEDTLDRLYMGKATEGDQMLARNAIIAMTEATPAAQESAKDGVREEVTFEDWWDAEMGAGYLNSTKSIAESAWEAGKATTATGLVGGVSIDDALKYAWAKHYAEGSVVSEGLMRQVIRTALEAAIGREALTPPPIDNGTPTVAGGDL